MDSPPEKEPLQKFLSRAKYSMNSKSRYRQYTRGIPYGFLIIEDFGDTTLFKKISENKILQLFNLSN